ncbi:type I restriction enzyme M protein [Ruminococcus sp. YRD2003]|uniref:N-6 DNA methylase n=1 Tax=Ruminococcus sp. YRD2003 TaxID=1452313 RepID=UPI0008BA1F31|nr:type I restriction enzyme M protein [Ruminococcus flavefaciens]
MDSYNVTVLKKRDTSKAAVLLQRTFKDNTLRSNYSAAYVIAKTRGNIPKDFDAFLEEYPVRPQVSPVLMNTLGNKWEVLHSLVSNCKCEDYAAYLLFESFCTHPREYSETPAGLSRLSARLLEISPDNRLADLCAGQSSFIRECRVLGYENDCTESEINAEHRVIAMMRADILGGKITVTSEDSLKLEGEYDKIFCHSPMGVKWKFFDPYCNHSASADWLFAGKCIELMADNGKAVCVFMNSTLWNQSDSKWREKFVSSGYIETIVALPTNLYSETSVSSSLVVFSKSNNSVNMIDATEIFTPVRRRNTLSDENVEEILGLLGKKCGNSRTVGYDEIAGNNYDLYPKSYTEEVKVEKDSVPFSELITRVTRGAQIKAGDLDSHFSESETDTRLLMLSDMNKGVISNDLTYLKGLDKRYDKYCATDGALVMTKNGFPVKTAIVSLEESQRYLVNGNLYIIEIDESKTDPFYLKAYLDSQQGQAQLRSILVGTAILNLPIEALKGLMIPMCSMTEQKRISEKYIKKQQEIIKLQEQLEKAEKELTEFFLVSE